MFRSPLGSVGAVCTSVLVALGGFLAAEAVADVRATPHNLIRPRDKSVSETEVCVFCHTPVIEIGENLAANATANQMSLHPLWQKSVDVNLVFTIFDDIGRRGLGKPSVGSQSIACLSCHDSNQAFSAGRTSEDHPFGVPYRGATKHTAPISLPMNSLKAEAAPFKIAEHLTALDDFRDVSQGTVEGRRVWWVSKDGVTARRTRSDLPLYGRVEGSVDAGGYPAESERAQVPFIECSSCHDPHSERQTFLRIANEGSMLCLTCHQK